MKYRINPDFHLEQRHTFGHGTVFLAKNKKNGELLILDKKDYRFLSELSDDIFIETDHPQKSLSYLLSEQVLLFSDGFINKDSYCEAMNFWLQVTDTCNLACDYCYIPSLNSKKRMNPNVFSALADKLISAKGLNSITVKIAGGEPLVAFKSWSVLLEEFINRVTKRGIELNVRIISNLTILTKEMIAFIKRHHIQLSVSLDGIGSWHNKTRIYTGTGKGSFDTVWANILKLKEHELSYAVMITVSSSNYQGIPFLVQKLVDEGIVFRIADAKGGFLKEEEFKNTMDTVFNIMNSAPEYSLKRKVVISDLRTHYPSSTPCSMGVSSAAIYLDGSVYFCHTEFERGDSIGSLFEDASLLEIIRRGRKKHLNLHEDCHTCEYRLICAGGCPLYRVEGKSPMCSTYKQVISQVFDAYAKE